MINLKKKENLEWILYKRRVYFYSNILLNAIICHILYSIDRIIKKIKRWFLEVIDNGKKNNIK